MLEMLSHEPFFFMWQITVAQMVGFVIFFLIMKRFCFDRILGFIRQRDQTLSDAGQRIGEARKEIDRLAAEYQAKLAAADKAAYEETQKMIREGIASKGAILMAAQDDGRKVMEEARAVVSAEKEAALRSMDAPVRSLAADLAAAATGGAVSTSGAP
jgi:F-type H+-transporting ATPase subunit b